MTPCTSLALPILLVLAASARAEDSARPSVPRAPASERGKESGPALQRRAGGPCPAGTVRLPGGTYKMGSRDVSATVKAFCLDATEVTVGAYARCAGAGDCPPAHDTVDWPGIEDEERTKQSRFCNGDRKDRRDHPVNCVTWTQATSYCQWARMRLPTEEEWEWAARGAERGSTYPWGEAEPRDQLCWDGEGNDLGKGKRRGTCAVASHPRGDSPQGVKDLAGNVWEWTSSCEDASCQRRVYRGGGWFNDDVEFVPAAYRYWGEPSSRIYALGFRCAASVE